MVQQLIFDEPRPSKPPRHLADLDTAGRASAVAELGLPAFRAKQLAQQKAERPGGGPVRALISICAAGGQGVAAILEV